MTSRSLTWMGAALVAGASLLACDGESDDLSPLLGVSPEATIDADAPTLGELTRALSLTEEQATAVAPALERWRSGAGEDRGEPGRRWSGGPMRFLAESSPALTQHQTTALIQWMGTRNGDDGDRPRRVRGKGLHAGGGSFGRFGLRAALDDLDVDADMRAEIHALVRETADATRDILSDYHDGTITAEVMRDRIGALRVETEASLETRLGAETTASLRKTLDETRAKMAARQLERMGTHHPRRIEFLSAVLSLDEDQTSKLETLSAEAMARRVTLLTQLRDGSLSPEEALYGQVKNHADRTTALRALLTAEQQETLDALETVRFAYPKHDRQHRRSGEGRHERRRG